jgi:hypothetical protein
MSLFLIVVPQTYPQENDWVSAEYISERTGLSVRTVSENRKVFDLAPINKKPLRWHYGMFVKWQRKKAEELAEVGKPQRLSLVRRKRKTA